MLSGRDALKSIDGAIAALRTDQDAHAARLSELTGQIAGKKAELAGQFARLAEVRLDAIRRGEVGERLSAAEARARELIAGHFEALGRIEKEIAAGDDERAALTQARDKVLAKAEKAQKSYDEALAEFQNAVRRTKAYKEAFAEADEAQQVLAEAERKAQLAADDRAGKGAPYEADPLFMYLWQRGFATNEYTARGLARLLDRWVAGIIGYRDAAANYRMLLEIPRRLAEHVAARRKALDGAREALRAVEDEAKGNAALKPLAEAVEAANAELAALDEKIAAESARRDELEAGRARLVRGDDSPYREAVELLGFEFSRRDLDALLREARLTATPEDDVIVQRIDALREDIADLDEDAEEARGGLAGLDRRRTELESVRGRYVGSRFDDIASYFEDDTLLKGLLAGVLQGVLSSGGMWREIERAHRRSTRASPDFGWRRFPSPGSGPVFRPGGGGFGGSRGGGMSGGGGFRTGGGF